MRKKSKASLIQVPGGSKITRSRYSQKMHRKVPKWWRRITGHKMIQWNGWQRYQIGQGQQIVDLFPAYVPEDGGPATRVHLSSVTVSDMVKMINTHADSPITTPDITVPSNFSFNDTRLWIEWNKVKYRLKNQTNRDLTVHIYDLTPRQSSAIFLDPSTSWEKGFEERMVNSALPAGISKWRNMVGSDPQKSHHFNRNFRILSHHRVFLKEGQEHHHSVFLSPKYPTNSGSVYSTTNAEGQYMFKGMSVMTMVVAHGAMTADFELVDSALGVPTFSKGSLHVLVEGKCKFQALGRSKIMYMQNGTIDALPGDHDAAVDDETHEIGRTEVVPS